MKFPNHVEFVGYADVEKRKKLMAGAKGAFVPSMYVEPFGGVQIEMLFSGTPTITTDWGAFTETVIDGVTGFRCRTFGEFKRAAIEAEKLDPHVIRERAINTYSLDVIGKKYEDYFTRLLHMWDDGWYEGRSFGKE
jgi:glycosyltransferase involved in cell wall biosynthesis